MFDTIIFRMGSILLKKHHTILGRWGDLGDLRYDVDAYPLYHKASLNSSLLFAATHIGIEHNAPITLECDCCGKQLGCCLPSEYDGHAVWCDECHGI